MESEAADRIYFLSRDAKRRPLRLSLFELLKAYCRVLNRKGLPHE